MKITKETKIALVAIAGIVILFFGLNFLKGMTVFSNDNTYYISFRNVSGLSASNPIYADGYQVGIVKGIDYDYDNNGNVIVKFDVDNNLRIPKGSTAEIVSDIMGNVKMNLLLANNPRERVSPGDTIQGDLSAGLMDQVGSLMPAVKNMIPKIDSILNSVNQLLADHALRASLHNVQTITANLTETSRQLNTLMTDINGKVPGMMQKADYALDKAGSTLDNADKLTANLASVDIDGTMTKVNQTLDNVEKITADISSGKGSLGLLMNDTQLYYNLNNTVNSANKLMTDLREHPKRYVHFSVFGKKDK